MLFRSVNKFIKTGATAGNKQYFLEMVLWITAIQIALLLIETLVRFYFSYITAWLGQHVVKDLRVKVYNKILHLNLGQFDKTPIGTLTTRTINDIESINDIFSDGLIPIIADLLAIISIVTVMLVVDWQLALVCLAPFPILIIATYFFKEKAINTIECLLNIIENDKDAEKAGENFGFPFLLVGCPFRIIFFLHIVLHTF